MFGSNFPYLVDILPLREGHLCPSSISCQLTPSWRRRVAQKNTPALIIAREPREGLQQWPGPRQLVLGRVYWDLPTDQVVPLSQAIEDTDTVTVSGGYYCWVSLCV